MTEQTVEPDLTQWVVSLPGDEFSGYQDHELLITYYPPFAGAAAGIEVAPRLDGTTWGPPLPVRDAP